MKFRAVIFDLFGTLVDNFSMKEHKRILSDMASVLGAPNDSFIKLWFNTFNMRCIGEFANAAENITHICRRLQISPNEEQLKTAEKIRFNFTRSSLAPKENAIETLLSIKQRGHKLGLISDCSSEVPAIWEETPFSNLFDTRIFSCEVGIKKPDGEVYRLACEKMSVAPARCLYVGDGGSNELAGAQSAGLSPLLFRDPKEVDAHRIDAAPWNGRRISGITEVLDYI